MIFFFHISLTFSGPVKAVNVRKIFQSCDFLVSRPLRNLFMYRNNTLRHFYLKISMVRERSTLRLRQEW